MVGVCRDLDRSGGVARFRPGGDRGSCRLHPHEQRRTIASIVAAEQVRVLQANGIDEFHFYTLNRPDLTYTIAHVLGVRPRSASLPSYTNRR